MDFETVIETLGRLVDVAGVFIIAGGIGLVTVTTLARHRADAAEATYRSYRRAVGKVILLGLELLVAADIIRTVAIGPTLEGVAVLGLIVLVRTFLSFSLEVELYGRWPWQRGSDAPAGSG